MKIKSLTKILVALTLVTALFAGFSPSASARGDGDDQMQAASAAEKLEICTYEGANICLVPSAVNFVTACVTTSLRAGTDCPTVDVSVAAGDELSAGETTAIELGGCIGLASCNDFIATCAGGGGTPTTIIVDRKGQPLAAICT